MIKNITNFLFNDFNINIEQNYDILNNFYSLIIYK